MCMNIHEIVSAVTPLFINLLFEIFPGRNSLKYPKIPANCLRRLFKVSEKNSSVTIETS